MSEIRANTVSNAAGTGPVTLTGQYAAKAWCNFQADVPSVRDSFNVASVTDNGSCNYTFNFSSNMGNANYSVSGYVKDGATAVYARTASSIDGDAYSTSAFQVRPSATSDTVFSNSFDPGYVCMTLHGDLA